MFDRTAKITTITDRLATNGYQSIWSFVESLPDDVISNNLPDRFFCYDCGDELDEINTIGSIEVCSVCQFKRDQKDE